ncbi:hypothetical protein C8P63_10227 [Melghirimyces profundicolus]|uniref:Uncharacterized protein n=1 Tax=Melghirimyces profundicolus TaxID=1242148 RepID=A0A2T6C892_9BACL|nr:hypothetical protein [Melghirimyces profundicolus]PTX64534.1 hypothetical protein C8P63_10227 [Melghirimyces profundicolus]
MAKKKRRRSNRPKEPKIPPKRKMIKESDLYYSRVVAPLRRDLRRARRTGRLDLVDDLWKQVENALRQHRILLKRARFVVRP